MGLYYQNVEFERDKNMSSLPVIVPYDQHNVFTERSQVLPLVVHIHSIVGSLKHQSLPVMDLLEHLQKVPVTQPVHISNINFV